MAVFDTGSRTDESVDLRNMLERHRLEDLLSTGQSCELFGMPGAGKTLCCREVAKQLRCLSTVEDMPATEIFNGRRLLPLPKIRQLPRIWRSAYSARRFWAQAGEHERRFLDSFEHLINQFSFLPEGLIKRVRRRIRVCGWFVAAARTAGERVIVDEALLKKLSMLLSLWLDKYHHSDQLHQSMLKCLETYPWGKLRSS